MGLGCFCGPETCVGSNIRHVASMHFMLPKTNSVLQRETLKGTSACNASRQMLSCLCRNLSGVGQSDVLAPALHCAFPCRLPKQPYTVVNTIPPATSCVFV